MQLWALAQAMWLLPRVPRPIRRALTSYGGGPAAMLDAVELRNPSSL